MCSCLKLQRKCIHVLRLKGVEMIHKMGLGWIEDIATIIWRWLLNCSHGWIHSKIDYFNVECWESLICQLLCAMKNIGCVIWRWVQATDNDHKGNVRSVIETILLNNIRVKTTWKESSWYNIQARSHDSKRETLLDCTRTSSCSTASISIPFTPMFSRSLEDIEVPTFICAGTCTTIPVTTIPLAHWRTERLPPPAAAERIRHSHEHPSALAH